MAKNIQDIYELAKSKVAGSGSGGNTRIDASMIQLPAATQTTQAAKPTVGPNGEPLYQGTYEDQLKGIYDKIQNREKFNYDVNADPLYQQYKDQYIQGGKLAMRDTMGKAAALNGGYGSTYAQQVGQQAYDSYLQNLTNAIPELYQTALNKYNDEGAQLMQQYGLAGDLRDTEYNRWRNELGDWENQRAWDYQVEQDAWARQQQEEQWAYQKQQQAYSNLYQAILQTGYKPTDAELKAAGMTRAQANNAKAMWDRTYAPVATGGGGGGSYNYTPKTTDNDTNNNSGKYDSTVQAAKTALANGYSNNDVYQAMAKELRAQGASNTEVIAARQKAGIKGR